MHIEMAFRHEINGVWLPVSINYSPVEGFYITLDEKIVIFLKTKSLKWSTNNAYIQPYLAAFLEKYRYNIRFFKWELPKGLKADISAAVIDLTVPSLTFWLEGDTNVGYFHYRLRQHLWRKQIRPGVPVSTFVSKTGQRNLFDLCLGPKQSFPLRPALPDMDTPPLDPAS